MGLGLAVGGKALYTEKVAWEGVRDDDVKANMIVAQNAHLWVKNGIWACIQIVGMRKRATGTGWSSEPKMQR